MHPAHNHGRTALQAAVEGGHVEVVKLLLAKGAEVNAKIMRYGGKTALQAAASVGHLELVQLLLAVGAQVNAEGSYYRGCTALYTSAEGGHLEVVQTLLDAGADVHMMSGNNYRTPLQAAMFMGRSDVVDLLKQAELESQ